MKPVLTATIFSMGVSLIGGVSLSLAASTDDTSSMAPKLSPSFPKSDKCTNSSPCRDVVGEIVKIEESYWVKMPNGNQTHMRIVPETKMDSRLKVGDSIAAQLTASGDADAIVKFDQKPKTEDLTKPKETLKDIR